MIKTDENLNFSVDSQLIHTELSEQGSFCQAGQNKFKKCYVMIKNEQNKIFPVGSQCSWEISLHVGDSVYTIITQKLKCTYGWLRFNYNFGGFTSDGILPR